MKDGTNLQTAGWVSGIFRRSGPQRRRFAGAAVAYGFLLPFFVPFILLSAWPILRGFYLSLTNTSLLTAEQDFVGLANYIRFFDDRTYRESLRNTLVFVIESVPIIVILALFLALLLNQRLFGRAAIRAAFVAPYLITGSAMAIIWQFTLNPQSGLLNQMLVDLGLPTQRWLSVPGQAMWAVVGITVWWRIGFPLLVILAGLQEIPTELYEAAELDGANQIQRFRFITLPLLAPVLFFVVIVRLIDSFKVFPQTFLVTGGGPVGSTRVLLQYLYEVGFQDYRTGVAAAVGWSLFLMILVVTLINLVVARKVENYEYD